MSSHVTGSVPSDISRYVDITVPAAGPVTLDIPDTLTGVELGDVLGGIFAAHPGLDQVELRFDGKRVGATSPFRVRRLAAGSSRRGAGAGDHLSLPGESRRWVVLVFGCTHAGCPSRVLRLTVDEDDWPRCPDGHGRMRQHP